MKYYKKSQQDGRTMLEILLVLAVIGLITTLGILTFPRLLEKYREQKILEEYLVLANEIRIKYSTSGDYSGITNETLVEHELVDKKYVGEDRRTITFANKNGIFVKVAEEFIPLGAAFELSITNLSNKECFYIGSQDYRSTLSEVHQVGIGVKDNLTYFKNTKPLISEVKNLCDCEDEASPNNCTIALTFL